MAHALDDTTGKVAFAYTGSPSRIWHGLGQQIDETATEQEWIAASVLDWRIMAAQVEYHAEGSHLLRAADDRVVLYRSDTHAPLGVVSTRFQPVDPAKQFHFFGEFCKLVDAKLSTAGSLFGGKQIFASAEIGESIRIIGSDVIRPIIMFHTANDGSFTTTIRNVATRPVCNNTVSAARAESKQGLIVCSHRSTFDPVDAANEMASWVKAQHAMAESFRMLAQTPVQMTTADSMVFDLFNDKRAEGKKQDKDAQEVVGRNIRNSHGYKTIMGLFAGNGRGANMPGVKGTGWGLFNAVTEYADHHQRAKSDSQRFENSQFGTGAKLKETMLDKLLTFANAE